MGVYDTILVPCPKCKRNYQAQSKSGKCLLRVFLLHKAPIDVLEDVNRHAPFICKCGCVFEVDFKPYASEIKSSSGSAKG